jgi:hypothetical protein
VGRKPVSDSELYPCNISYLVKCKICSRQLHAAAPLTYSVPPKQCPGGKYPLPITPPPLPAWGRGAGGKGGGGGEDLEDWRGPNLICEDGEEELKPGLISRGSIPLKAERIGRGGIRGLASQLASARHPAGTSGQPPVNLQSTSGQPLVSLRSTSGQPLVSLWSASGQPLVNLRSASGQPPVSLRSTSGQLIRGLVQQAIKELRIILQSWILIFFSGKFL